VKRASNEQMADFLHELQELIDNWDSSLYNLEDEPTSDSVEAPKAASPDNARRQMVAPRSGATTGSPDQLPAEKVRRR